MPAPRPGRPRSESVQRAILEGARDELGTNGYDKFSIDRVASASGVSKQAIYRRYPSKSALIADALLGGYLLTPSLQAPDTGDIRADLLSWLLSFAEYSASEESTAFIRAATAASAENHDIALRFRQQVNVATLDTLVRRLEDAEAKGQLRTAVTATTIAEIVIGVLVYRLLTGQKVTKPFLHEVTDILFSGLLP